MNQRRHDETKHWIVGKEFKQIRDISRRMKKVFKSVEFKQLSPRAVLGRSLGMDPADQVVPILEYIVPATDKKGGSVPAIVPDDQDDRIPGVRRLRDCLLNQCLLVGIVGRDDQI